MAGIMAGGGGGGGVGGEKSAVRGGLAQTTLHSSWAPNT